MGTQLTSVGIAREEALKALARVRRGAPVSDAIQAGRRVSPQDRALMTQLVYGVLRHQRYLDAWMKPYLRTPLDPDVANILRLAFFQLGFLDRVPAYAVVNAAVEQTKAHQPRAANLVNAILRRGAAHPPEGLSLGEQYSHPDWLVERWRKRYGVRVEDILKADNQVPPLTFRVNLSRTSRAAVLEQLAEMGIQADPSPYLPEAIRVSGAVWLEDLPAFREGLVTVQDESGMLVAWVLDPQPGQLVCDMAAGLGGKAIHALERASDTVRLTALDISEARLARLKENLARTRYQDSVRIVHSPAERYAAQHSGEFDRVILDAPCSGLGVLRRRVDARWKKTEADFSDLAAEQRSLLESAWTLVKRGGIIVYSTCSTEPEETEAVLRGILDRHPDMVKEDVSPYLPHEALGALVEDKALVLAPGDLGMDGFYIARIRVGIAGLPGSEPPITKEG